jgi:hypothetical protein
MKILEKDLHLQIYQIGTSTECCSKEGVPKTGKEVCIT